VASTELQTIQKGSTKGEVSLGGKLIAIVLVLHQPVASTKPETIQKGSYTGGGISRG